MENPHTVNSTTDKKSREVLSEAVKVQQTPSLAQRCAFMKLPLEERRRVLVEQADAIAVHYKEDSEWQELQTGDLIEY